MKFCSKMYLIILLFFLPALLFAGFPLKTAQVEAKVDSLMKLMTLEEKVGQLVQFHYTENHLTLLRQGMVGSFLNVPRDANETNRIQKIAVEETRLGIPLIFGYDVIHGLRTIFPIPLAEAASFSPETAERNAHIAATEAAAAGVHWTFAPMVDIARDPRWGRIAEGSGEDTYLGSALAAARVKGFQGDDFSQPDRVVACAKHYVAYGAGEGGRDYNTVEMSIRTLFDVYLPPFEAATNAGVGTFMSAFNDLNGIPTSANRFTLTEILRNRWHFEGFVVSDWNSVGELLNHGIAANPEEAAYKALFAGVDMDMEGRIYLNNLVSMIKDEKLPETLVDQAARRVLRIKFLAGLFDEPYTDTKLAKVILSKDHVQAALEAARQSIVLLKNQNNLLPLKDVKTLAVIGPLADSQEDVLGTWKGDGQGQDAVSVLAGIKNAVSSGTTILSAKGCDVRGDDRSGFAEAVATANKADAVIAVLGESADMSGEGGSRADIELPGVQRELLKELLSADKPVVLVLLNGRPLALGWEAANIAAIVESWQLGIQHGNAVADVLFGNVNPSGKLPATFPRLTGQVPIHYNHLATGRPYVPHNRFTTGYIDTLNSPIYPFGYGLSYTTFEYSNLQLEKEEIGPAGSLTVSATVQNSGKMKGDEVVQLYIRDMAGSMTRPVKELKGFQRITLNPGESKTVQFTLGPGHLGFHNQKMEYIVEPGDFKVWIGPNSQEGLEGQFRIVGSR